MPTEESFFFPLKLVGAGQSGIGCKRARDIAAPAHLEALIAARPRIQAVTAGLLLQWSLEDRPNQVIETATSTYLEALDDEDKATAELHAQKAAQTADEAWQQTIKGLQDPASQTRQFQPSNTAAPPLKKKIVKMCAPQLQAQLSRLTDRTRLRRMTNTLLSSHTHVSHKWLYHLDACAGSVLTPHDYITNVQKRLGY